MVPTLDLHGKRYDDARKLVEEFLASNEPPMRIVTGLSPAMTNIVVESLEKGLRWQYENDWNLGSLLIISS